MNSLVRPVISVYDAIPVKKVDLYNAYNITIREEFGSYPELTFRYPLFIIDANGQMVIDDNGLPVYDNKISFLKNEILVWVNDNAYSIKSIENGRESDGRLYFKVSCKHKADELGYKQIKFLDLSPPLREPVNAQRALIEVITQPNQVDLGYGTLVAGSFSQFTLDTSSTFNFNNYFISILDGSSKYQTRRITSYNTTTKVGSVSVPFGNPLNNTSVYRIHRAEYGVGIVSPELLTSGLNAILRSLKFEDTTIMDGLNTIAQRFGGKLRYRSFIENTQIFTLVDLLVADDEYAYEFRYGKDINSISRTVDSNNGCYTRVYPEGRNNLSVTSVPTSQRTDSFITYDEHVLGSGEIFNFQYWLSIGYDLDTCQRRFIRDFRFIEEGYTDALMLFDGAKEALEELSLPKITYELSAVDFPTDDNKIIQRLKKYRFDDSDFMEMLYYNIGGVDYQFVQIKIPVDMKTTLISGYNSVFIDGLTFKLFNSSDVQTFTWYPAGTSFVCIFPDNYFSTENDAIAYFIGKRVNYPVSTIMGSYTELPEVGDRVAVKDTQLGFDFTATVAERTIDYDNPQRPTIVLSNFVDVMGDLYYKIIKSQEGYSFRKSLYGKATTIIIADEATSLNWRYADYVVPADGSESASSIIQKVINDVFAQAGGGEIYLAEGSYGFNSTVNLQSNIVIVGAGHSTRIFPLIDMGLAFNISNRQNVEIRDLFIDYRRQSDGTSLANRFSDGVGVYSGTSNFLIERVRIEYVNNNMFIAIGCTNITVRNCQFTSEHLSFIGTECIDLKACRNGRIEGSSFIGKLNASQNIILLTSQVGLASGEFFIINNYFELDITGIGYITASFDTGDSFVLMEQNVVVVKGSGRSNIRVFQCGEGVVRNNIIHNGFINIGSAANVGQYTVQANEIYSGLSSISFASTGIQVSKSTNARIVDNKVRRGSRYAPLNSELQYGITIASDVTGALVSNNDLTNSGIFASILDNGVGTITLGGNRL